MKKEKSALIVLALFLIPFIINYLLTFGLNGWRPIKTIVGNNEWLTFWGTYLAFVGTFYLGYVAYLQNKESLKINKTTKDLTEAANRIQQDLLKIEKDKKTPFLVIDTKKKIYVDFNCQRLYNEFVDPSFLEFRVSKGTGKICAAKIGFRIRNETENLVKNVELKKIKVKFGGSEIDDVFIEYAQPENIGRVVYSFRDVVILLGLEVLESRYEQTEKINTMDIRFEFYITNIYNDVYKVTLSVFTQAKKKRAGFFEGVPYLIEANVAEQNK